MDIPGLRLTEADRESLAEFIKAENAKMTPEQRQHIHDMAYHYKLEAEIEKWQRKL